jgi:hypothetical protein
VNSTAWEVSVPIMPMRRSVALAREVKKMFPECS